MAGDGYILTLDPGATYTKGVVWDYCKDREIEPHIVGEIYRVESSTKTNPATGITCETSPDKVFELLGKIPEKVRSQLRAIVVTSHGATQIPLNKRGDPVFGVVSYDSECFNRRHDEFLERFGGREQLYLETGSAEYGKGINAAQQLYFLQQEFPQEWAQVTDLLPLSNYISFLLTDQRERKTDHTHTRNHAYLEAIKPAGEGWAWSNVVTEMGLNSLFPGFVRPFDVYGQVSFSLNSRYGISRDCVVVSAGHDTSIASLLAPNYANTGTWICNTATGVPVDLTPEMEKKGIVVNADPWEQNLRTLMARLGQTREAYMRQFGEINPSQPLPPDVPFEGINLAGFLPLAFMEGVGVYESNLEAKLPPGLQGDVSKFFHSLALTIAIPEALSSIFTSDHTKPMNTTLAGLLQEGYEAKPLVIGGNFVNDVNGEEGTFTGYFRRVYPGEVWVLDVHEPTSYAAAILGHCALEGKDPKDIRRRTKVPMREITYDEERKEIADLVRIWESFQRAETK